MCIKHPGSKWFIAREELKRLMSSTFVTFTKVCAFHNIPNNMWKLNGQYNYIEFTNGSRIDLLDVKKLPTDPMYERFGSLEYSGGAIEEAGEVDFGAFDVLKTRIGRHMNHEIAPKILITCNPKKNWLYTMVYKPWRNNQLPKEFTFIPSLYNDNPYTAESYEKQLSQISNDINRQRLMYGIWEYEDEPGTLFTYQNIIDMWGNPITNVYGKYITADIARYGSDKTVFYVWNGLKLVKKVEYTKQGVDTTALYLRELAVTEEIPYKNILVDEDGIGGAVTDLCRGVWGFMNNSTPLPIENPQHEENEKTNYGNLKTQCADIMAMLVDKHEVSIAVKDQEFKEKLTEELSTYKIKNPDNDTQKIRLVSKDEQKDTLGRSPDYGDAFIMRGFFELKRTFKAITPQQAKLERQQQVMEDIDFDPFSVFN